MAYAIDLFCGAGGMSEGMIQAGFQILFSSDINEAVQQTYMNRHHQLGLLQGVNTYFHRSDIRDLTGELIWDAINGLDCFSDKNAPDRIDAIFGGPPCQGFSRAGRRKPDDPRNLLFKEYLRVIYEVSPRYVVMENVEGFLDMKFYGFVGGTGKIYEDGAVAPDILREELQLLGYHTLEPRVLNAADYGVPQRRQRIIFIAYQDGERKPLYPLPITDENHRVTIQDAISDLIRDEKVKNRVFHDLTTYQRESIKGRTKTIDGKTLPSKEYINNELSSHSQLIIERFSLFREGEDGSALRKRIMTEGIDLSDKKELIKLCVQSMDQTEEEVLKIFLNAKAKASDLEVLLTKKNIRTRLSSDAPSATVMTIPDDYISPFEHRTFSVRELARLQSFDDSFEFLGKRTTGGLRRRVEVPQYSQVGNAVPPLLAKAVAAEILKVL